MKKIHILVLLVIFGCFNLTAQIMINGILSDQIKIKPYKTSNIDCDTIFAFSTQDGTPIGLTFDGSLLYTNAQISGLIHKYNLNGQLAGTIPAPGTWSPGSDLDFDGTFLWVVAEQDGKIYKLDTINGTIITSFDLPTGSPQDPNNFGCAYDDGYIWVTEYIDETLMKLNSTTGAVVDSFEINRRVLPLTIIDGTLYGLEFIGETPYSPMQLIKFDKLTGAVIDSLPWCLPYSLGFCWAGNHMWGMSSGNGIAPNRIYEFDSLLVSNIGIAPTNKFVSIFPNPAKNKIVVNSSEKINTLEVFNINGQIVYSLDNINQKISIEVDLSIYKKGMYFVKITLGKNSHTRRSFFDKYFFVTNNINTR